MDRSTRRTRVSRLLSDFTHRNKLLNAFSYRHYFKQVKVSCIRIQEVGKARPASHSTLTFLLCSTRENMHGSSREIDGQVHMHVRQAGKKKDIDP